MTTKFITSTNKNPLLENNRSYAEKIKSSLPFLDDEYYRNNNPVIAGSFILRNLFSYESPYEDIDFYFLSEAQRKYSFIRFQSIGTVQSDTKFATTFLIGTRMKVQLIKKIYSSQMDVIDSFDFTTSMVCFQPKYNSFTYSIDCLYSWYRKIIKLNRSPLFEMENINTSNCTDAFLYFNLLLRRLKKYTQRYSMVCDKDFYNQLCEYAAMLIEFTQENSWAFKYYVKNSSGSQVKISVNFDNINTYINDLLEFNDENLLPG